jgi:2-dehydro-3-deoxygluconokinase
MSKILCFGESLLRLVPDLSGPWLEEGKLRCHIGGAELNVAMALANWGHDVSYLTALPENAVTENIKSYIHSKGIDISLIRNTEGRLGIYYLPENADLKNAGVVYDRTDSAFYKLKPGEINWDEIFEEVSWFHISAISPALNQNLADLCIEAVKGARSRNISISIDLNYRAKLWQYTSDPVAIMLPIVSECQVIMGNIWSAEKLLGIALDTAAIDQNEYIKAADKTASQIFGLFDKCTTIAFTFRFENERNVMNYQGYLNNRSASYISPQYEFTGILDKVGSGDCFMAALIHGIKESLVEQDLIDLCATAAIAKLFEKGDHSSRSIEEINSFVKDNFISSNGKFTNIK